jgi:hypothetical protein
VLRPGGQVGFSDLVFDRPPTAAEDRALRALLYDSARELLTDWPGFTVIAGGWHAVRQPVRMPR